MAKGSDSFKGLGVPLFGDFELKQRTAATDVVTITGASGQTGDFIVCAASDGTEKFIVLADGSPVIPLELFTTAPSTGLVAGQLFHYTAGNAHYLGIGTAAGTLVEVLLN